MLIISTFNLDCLKSPLQCLLNKFTSESVSLRYSNKNLILDILSLNQEKSDESTAILLRLFDLSESDLVIDEAKLKNHLKHILEQLMLLKSKKTLPLIVFLCPSPEKFKLQFENIEKTFIKELKENKIYALSLNDIQEKHGMIEFENPIGEITHTPYIPLFYRAIACFLARKLHVIKQRPFKVIVVDCDNTLWTGVAADEGAEKVVFKDHNILLQEYLVKQQEKGIIICLSSKNEEKTVLDVFRQRQAEMSLKLAHILKYKINWEEKSKNILEIAQELNLNPDSFRFIDDNPLEINDVKQIPGVFCITMPQNLKEYKDNWIFDIDEHAEVTETDKKRTDLYKQAEIKGALAISFRDPIEYLNSPELNQTITISKINSIDSEFDKMAIERASELSGRTNQFNLFPDIAKEINEIESIIKSEKGEIFVGRIKDNFSPTEDITAIAIISLDRSSLTINNFFVSCRVFRRGMEYVMLKHIAEYAYEKKLKNVNFIFKKSEKNNPVGSFLNILSEQTNKHSRSRNLFDRSINLTWLHNSFKFLFKKLNICLNFNSLELGEEFILTLSTRGLMNLDLTSLLRASFNSIKTSEEEQKNKEIIFNKNEIDENYLTELKKINSKFLSKNYSENIKEVIFLPDLMNKILEVCNHYSPEFMSKLGVCNHYSPELLSAVIEKCKDSYKLMNEIDKILEDSVDELILGICNYYLGEDGQFASLVARGLNSIKATEVRLLIYGITRVTIPVEKFLSEKTTSFILSEYVKKEIKPLELAQTETDYVYNQALPVSIQQQRIWVAEKKEQANNSSNFHMTACYKVSKKLNVPCFKSACQKFIELYDVFGASFFMQEGTLKQLILAPSDRKLNFKEIKLAEVSLSEAIKLELSKSWTIENKPSLLHFILFEDRDSYHIFMHVHHAIFDAVSLNNSFKTISELYLNILTSNSKKLNYPPQYIEFIHYQQKIFTDEAFKAKALSFWYKELSTIEKITMLPTDQDLAAYESASNLMVERYIFSLSYKELVKLKNLAKTNNVTCFNVISALFALLISSYTYQKHITLITAVNGRGGHASFEKMVGFFVNLLIQQFDLDGEELFINYLKKVNEKFLASQKYQDFPLSKIQEILLNQGIKEILLSPALIFQSYAVPKLALGEEIAELELPKQPIIFDQRETCRFGLFTLFAQENASELSFVIEYARDRFSMAFIKRFANNFKHAIEQVVKQMESKPDITIQEISLVCDEERNELIRLGQGPRLELIEGDNLVRRFQQSVEMYPDNDALYHQKGEHENGEYDEIKLTYRDVDNQSTHLAHALHTKGVKQGDLVGIFLDPNHLFFIAELAILKIGAIFVPLSKQDPVHLRKSIIENAGISFFILDISEEEFRKKIERSDLNCIHINERFSNHDLSLPALTTSMEDSACILYTSGTTGDPKGVMLPQKALFRVIKTLSYMVKPGNNIAQTADQAFDAAQLEFLLAILNGGCLVIIDKNVFLTKQLFSKVLLDKEIKIVWITSEVFNHYALNHPEIFKKVDYMITGGGVVDKNAVKQVLDFNPNIKIMNGCGPIETGIFATTFMVNKETLSDFSTVPIGLPTIAGTQNFILNCFNTLAPWGAIGELGISGEGLGSYYKNDTLQKEHFLPFLKNLKDNLELSSLNIPDRIYLSGDMVTIHCKHNVIIFLSRKNEDLIKIRGNSVSPPGIKKVLEEHPFVKQVEVVYRQFDEKSKSKILVAFYTQIDDSSCLTKRAFVEFLGKKLSLPKIPEHYEKIDRFPITRRGKLNITKLHDLPLTTVSDNESDKENVNESLKKIQNKLLQIFNKLFHFSITLDGNFFDSGLSSFVSMQLLKVIEEELGIIITYDKLHQNPTIRLLAYYLEQNRDQKKEKVPGLYEGTDATQPPIIFVHPAVGGLACFKKLSDAFKNAELPNFCYGIEDPVILDREVKFLTIPDMATNYLKYIREKIRGTFILAGYSFGGMIALEIAAQLEEVRNQDCIGIILLDTWVVSRANEKLKETLYEQVLKFCEEIIQEMRVNSKTYKIEELIQLLTDQYKFYQEIGFEYKPKNLSVTPVKLFKSKNTDKFKHMEIETEFNYLENFVELKNLEKHMVEGDHFNLLDEKANITDLSKKIVIYARKVSQNISNINNRHILFHKQEQNMSQKATTSGKSVFGYIN